MRYLLDTHVVLWWMAEPGRIADTVRDRISDLDHQVIVSAVVAWDISIKRSLGKLSSPDDLVQRIRDSQFEFLSVSFEHALAVESLPLHHRDPFDRLLIPQGMLENAVIVTHDEHFSKYDVTVLKA